jgi:hypothetical protein
MNARVADPLFRIIREEQAKTTNPVMTGINNFNSLGMYGLDMIDWACVAPGWLVIYEREYARLSKELDKRIAVRTAELVNQGLDADAAAQQASLETADDIKSEAVYLADDAVMRTQPVWRKANLAPMFKNNGELASALLQFQTSLNRIWQTFRYDLPEAVRKKQIGKIVGIVTEYALAGICLGLLAGLGDDDEEEKTPGQKAAWVLFYSLVQFTDSVPLIGNDVTGLAEKLITGKKSFYGNRGLLHVVNEAFSGLEAAPGMFNFEDPEKQKKAIGRVVEKMAAAAMLSTGTPLSAVQDLKRTAGIGDGDGKLDFNFWALVNGKK